MFNNNFFKVTKTTKPTSAGAVDLPILYYDSSAAMLLFLIDYQRALEKLEGTAWSPQRIGINQAAVALAFFEYRDTSIGAYNEVATCVMVGQNQRSPQWRLPCQLLTNSRKRELGFHIIDLPVTTEAARSAGKEIWGFPKFCTQIDFQLESDRFFGATRDPQTNDFLMKVEGSIGPTLPLPAMDLVLFSHQANELVKTIVDTKATFKTGLGRGLQLTVGSGDHPMAKNLLDLGLQGARPLLAQATNRFYSRLDPDHLSQASRIPWHSKAA